jgi:hypothetical protein
MFFRCFLTILKRDDIKNKFFFFKKISIHPNTKHTPKMIVKSKLIVFIKMILFFYVEFIKFKFILIKSSKLLKTQRSLSNFTSSIYFLV